MPPSMTLPRNNSAASSNSSRRAASNVISRRKARSPKQMKQIFKSKEMSLSGTFVSNNGVLPHDKIAGWIAAHGGAFVREVTDDTTHLICTIEDYKKKTAQVQKAWKLGKNKCYIVVFEWLEDSLIGPKGVKRMRAERGYTLDRTLNRIKKGKTNHDKFRAKFEEGVRISKDLCDNNLHHIYYDPTGFEYKVVLTRLNLGGRIITEKYTLWLFESNAIPHTYMCGAKFSRSHRPNSWYREDCYPKDFPSAFADFKRLFGLKTGLDWDQRLEKAPKNDPNKFVYTPPVLGRPVGWLPLGYVRPEYRVVEEEEKSGSESGGNVEYDTDSEVDEDEDHSSEPERGTETRTPTLDELVLRAAAAPPLPSPNCIQQKQEVPAYRLTRSQESPYAFCVSQDSSPHASATSQESPYTASQATNEYEEELDMNGLPDEVEHTEMELDTPSSRETGQPEFYTRFSSSASTLAPSSILSFNTIPKPYPLTEKGREYATKEGKSVSTTSFFQNALHTVGEVLCFRSAAAVGASKKG